MAITFLEEKKSKNYLVLFSGILLLLAISILIWRVLIQPEKVLPSTPIRPPEVKINFEVLKNPILKELQPFEEIKPFTGPIGRENPFLPY